MLSKRNWNGSFSYETIVTNKCDSKDFEQHFHKPAQRFANPIDINLPKLKCIQDFKTKEGTEIRIEGDTESAGSYQLSLFYTSCDHLNRGDCKTPAEVQEWLKHKYVLIAYTQLRSIQNTDEEVAETLFKHIPIDRITPRHLKFSLD